MTVRTPLPAAPLPAAGGRPRELGGRRTPLILPGKAALGLSGSPARQIYAKPRTQSARRVNLQATGGNTKPEPPPGKSGGGRLDWSTAAVPTPADDPPCTGTPCLHRRHLAASSATASPSGMGHAVRIRRVRRDAAGAVRCLFDALARNAGFAAAGLRERHLAHYRQPATAAMPRPYDPQRSHLQPEAADLARMRAPARRGMPRTELYGCVGRCRGRSGAGSHQRPPPAERC